MDCFRNSYVVLFRCVTKSIEELEEIISKEQLPVRTLKLIRNEIERLKDAQISAEEQFISRSDENEI